MIDTPPQPPRAPSSGTKKALIVLAALAGAGLLGCLVCGVSGWLWLQDKAAEMREMGLRIDDEVEGFAATHTQLECRDEAFRRSDACGPPSNVMCHAEASIFLRACLRAAMPSPGLCDGVPSSRDIARAVEWGAAQCAELGRAQDPSCPQLTTAIAQHCERAAAAPTPGP